MNFTNRLLGDAEVLYTSFLLQDFRCQKTKQLQHRLASGFSNLCEPLVMDHPTKTLREQLDLLHLVAKTHNFTYLQGYVEELQYVDV